MSGIPLSPPKIPLTISELQAPSERGAASIRALTAAQIDLAETGRQRDTDRVTRERSRISTGGVSMDVDPLFLGRIVERILVVIFGGLSLVLGWRLFMVGVVDPQIAEIKFKDWKVSLRQVGPGSVFAALGIGVMAFALSRPLEISEGTKVYATPPEAAGARTVSYLGTSDDLKHWVRVLNTFARLDAARLQGDSVLASDMRAELARAQEEIAIMRNLLLLEKFSEADIAAWQKYQDAYLNDPRSVPDNVRPTLSAIEPWMISTIVDER
jgi:hypothetical protein